MGRRGQHEATRCRLCYLFPGGGGAGRVLPLEGLEGSRDRRRHFLQKGDLGGGDALAVDGGRSNAGDYVKRTSEGMGEDALGDEGFGELGQGPRWSGFMECALPEPAELALDGVAAGEGDEGPGR